MYFGVFQTIMPILGYFLGNTLNQYIKTIDHYVILILLSIVGIDMIISSLQNNDNIDNDSTSFKDMIILSFVTSVDAFAVGITIKFLNCNLLFSCSVIGIITFILSSIGVVIGHKFGVLFNKKASIIGGAILVLLGIKIFLEHLI